MKLIENNSAFLMAMGEGSRIEIHADAAAKDSWTQIDQTAEVGDTTLVLAENVGWNVGDKIAIASTGFDMNQAEERTIIDVSPDGKTITLDLALEYRHHGGTETHDNGLEGDAFQSWEIDMRAEVALLSRNVTIQGDADSVEDGYGGHTMVMDGASMHIDGVEMTRMGQEGLVGRYPLHWHMLGDASGQYITNSSIHDTYNKGLTIHGTQNTWIEDVAIYDTLGHTYYFEDGSEFGNVVTDTLGMNTRATESVDAGPIGSDHTAVSTYWVTNPNNHLVNNHAAGSDDTGFWILAQDDVQGTSAKPEYADLYGDYKPHKQDPGQFTGNSAHSNVDDGLFLGLSFDETTGNTTGFAGLDTPYLVDDFTTYKNGEWGIWLKNGLADFNDIKAIENNTGIQIWGDAFVENSLFVGKSETNHSDDFPIESWQVWEYAGWTLYDHAAHFQNVHFDGFEGQYDSAISNGWGFGRSTMYSADGLTFGDRVGEDNKVQDTVTIGGSSTSDRGGGSAGALIDMDGAITGIPGAVLTPGIVDYNPGENWDHGNGPDNPLDPDYVYADEAGQNTISAAGFNYTEGAIWLEGARMWVHQPGTVFGRTAIDDGVMKLTDGPGVDDTVHAGTSNVPVEERAVYTATNSINGATALLNPLAIPSTAASVQFNTQANSDTVYIYEYTEAGGIPDALKVDVSDLALGDYVNYQFKGLPDTTKLLHATHIDDLVWEGAAPVTDADKLAAATGTAWYSDADGTIHVKAVANLYVPWRKPARSDTEHAEERLYFDEFKLIVQDWADYDKIGDTGDLDQPGWANPENEAFVRADPTPLPTRAESTSNTVEITDADTRWSNADGWDNGMPGADDIVIIGEGQRVVLDTDVTVKGILVYGGELVVEDKTDLKLASDWILVAKGGLFQVGAEENPFKNDFELTLEGDLEDNENDVDVMALLASTADTVVRAQDPPDPVNTDPITVVDEDGTEPWTEYTDTFDDNGVIVARQMLYDDGRVQDTEYRSGVAVRVTTEDVANAYNWSSTVENYRLGDLAQSVVTKDNGTIETSTYALGGGPLIMKTSFDAGSNYRWDRKETLFDSAGEVTSRSTLFDNGQQNTLFFTDGVKRRTEQTDTADRFAWDSKILTFTAEGELSSLTRENDNGSVLTKLYDADGLRGTTLVDRDDKFEYKSIVTFFDDEGMRAKTILTKDDGRVITTNLTDGVRTTREVLDGADTFEWHTRTWEYDSTGSVVDLTVVLDVDLPTQTTDPNIPEDTGPFEVQILPTNEDSMALF